MHHLAALLTGILLVMTSAGEGAEPPPTDAASAGLSVVAGGRDGFSGDGGRAIRASLSSPYGVAIDAAGNLFIADTHNNSIRRVDGATRIITTLIGNGDHGSGSYADAETSHSLSEPRGVAVDGKGNVFIADTGHQRILRLDVLKGSITTVAGSGAKGFSGDDGPAAAAQLSDPSGVAFDVAGNLLIADAGNHRIRRVDAATLVITTVAGTGTSGFSGDGAPATAAQLAHPRGVTVDGAGTIFIADTLNHRIRRVDGRTKLITTIAGNGRHGCEYLFVGNQFDWVNPEAESDWDLSLRPSKTGHFEGVPNHAPVTGRGGLAIASPLSCPCGVAVDGSGHVFIADTGYQRVCRVDTRTGILATVAGRIPDKGPDEVEKAKADNQKPETTAAGERGIDLFHPPFQINISETSFIARNEPALFDDPLDQPCGVAVDGSGRVIIADTGNHRIGLVAP